MAFITNFITMMCYNICDNLGEKLLVFLINLLSNDFSDSLFV